MKGILYGVGTGPGDPELMTLKAVRIIRECPVIAFPGKSPENSTAYKIAAAAVPEIAQKDSAAIEMPMTQDHELLQLAHRKGAAVLEQYLDRGQNVAFLTLGDPCIYSTFSYLQHILEQDGYPVEIISAVPSFCAAAAKLRISLTEWDEPLHIIPAVHKADEVLTQPGNYVLMKSASHMKEVKKLLEKRNFQAVCVENCGMEGERIYTCTGEIPDDAGYFSVIIAKNRENNSEQSKTEST